ncbi:MAG: hypothetical protein KGI25_08480, partial [Thaumarchaeota archaeon]|nr:hypothetical protein [Nitrososphaerota archaeon]
TTVQFHKDIGYAGLEQTFGWKIETREALARKSPRAMAIWSGDLLRCIMNLSKDLAGYQDEVVVAPKKKAV